MACTNELRARHGHGRLACDGLRRGGRRYDAWDPTLATLQADMQGPVAHTITTAAVIGTGLMWGVSEHGTGIRKVSGVAFGGALALGATVFMNAAFGAAA